MSLSQLLRNYSNKITQIKIKEPGKGNGVFQKHSEMTKSTNSDNTTEVKEKDLLH